MAIMDMVRVWFINDGHHGHGEDVVHKKWPPWTWWGCGSSVMAIMDMVRVLHTLYMGIVHIICHYAPVIMPSVI